MNKEDPEPKPSDKFIVENSLLTQKTKPQKEKKLQKVTSPTPKKIKKKVHFSNSKEAEKDEEKEKIISPKISQISKKNQIQSPTPKKNEKEEVAPSPLINPVEQKVSSEEGQISPSNSKENLKEIKEKRNWKSWSPQEKILFYEIIANGGNYSSLQKLFKTMNDVRIFYILFFLLKFLENWNKKHRKNKRFLLSYVKKCEYITQKSRRHQR